MSGSIGTIRIGMAVNTGGMSKGLGQARGQLSGFGGAVSSVGLSIKKANDGIVTSFAKIGLGIQGVMTLAKGITSALTAPLKLAAEAEQTAVSFNVLTGSVEQSEKTLGELRQFAASTPFQFPEIADSAKKLIAFGFSANEVTTELKKLGDISAGLNIPLAELSDIYGKAKVSGRLFMEDINQLAGRGIPIQEELAKQFGVTGEKVRDLVSSGKVNFSHLQTAITSLTGEGGKFAGLMDAQSKTLGGVFSTMKDNVGMALTEIGAGIADTFDLTAAASSITTFVQGTIPTIKSWMTSFKGIFDALKPITTQYFDVILAYWGMLSSVAMTAFNNIIGFIGQFLPSFGTMQNGILTALIAVEFGFKNWQSILSIAVSTVLASILGFAGQVQHTFTTVIPAYLSYLYTNFTDIFFEIGRVGQLMFGNLANNIVKILSNIPNLIRGKVSFSELWTPMTDEMTLQFAKMPEIPERVMGQMEAELRQGVKTMKSELAQGFQDFHAAKMDKLLPDESMKIQGIKAGEEIAKSMSAPIANAMKATGEVKLAEAATYGSQAARSSILRNQLSVPDKNNFAKEQAVTQKEQLKVQREQLKEQRKQTQDSQRTVSL